jgi:DNA-binding beta-propeller fold protein YncE
MKKSIIVVALILTLVAFLGMANAEERGPKLSGVAYVQGHGGHIAVVDLATGAVARISHGKPSDAITLSHDGNTIYTFSLDGFVTEIDLKAGKNSEWAKLGKQHCGSAIAPDGTIWVSDMTDGHVYVYDPKTKKLKDSFPISKSTCMITFSKDGKKAYVTDMIGGYVNIVDVATKKVEGKIETTGNFMHRGRLAPDGEHLWVSDGNEVLKNTYDTTPVAIGVGYAENAAQMGGVSIVDVKTKKEVDYIIIGGNPHDVAFTPDGKYALVTSRQIPDYKDSAIVVVDTNTKRIVKVYSACKACHGPTGTAIDAKKDGGSPYLCGIDVNWNQKAIPVSKSIESVKDLGGK